MLLGQVCTLKINGETVSVTFLGYDAGDARVMIAGTNKTMYVSPRALKRA